MIDNAASFVRGWRLFQAEPGAHKRKHGIQIHVRCLRKNGKSLRMATVSHFKYSISAITFSFFEESEIIAIKFSISNTKWRLSLYT